MYVSLQHPLKVICPSSFPVSFPVCSLFSVTTKIKKPIDTTQAEQDSPNPLNGATAALLPACGAASPKEGLKHQAQVDSAVSREMPSQHRPWGPGGREQGRGGEEDLSLG